MHIKVQRDIFCLRPKHQGVTDSCLTLCQNLKAKSISIVIFGESCAQRIGTPLLARLLEGMPNMTSVSSVTPSIEPDQAKLLSPHTDSSSDQ